jgi:hypothetical protein
LDGGRQVTKLFEIYGAVDQQVEDRMRPEEHDRISRLLPVYQGPRAYWFRSYVETRGLAQQEPESRAREALAGLAEIEPRGRLKARRVFAAAAAAHAFPNLSARELADAVWGRGELSDEDAEGLASLLRKTPDDSQSGRDASWEPLRKTKLTPEGLGPRPCSGQLAWATVDGDQDLVATLKTEFDAKLTFDAARNFCADPTTWKCFPSWCGMEQVDGQDSFDTYREVVSFDCTEKMFPKLAINLNFYRTYSGDPPDRVARAEYWLSKRQPVPNEDRPVLVNQGWLEVQELPSKGGDPQVRVTTTKSILFRDDLGGPGIASVSCRVGYLSMVGDLVACASKARADRKDPDEYPDAPIEASSPSKEPPTGLPYGKLTAVMMEETATAVEESIDDYLKASKAMYGKLGVQDMADYWAGLLRRGVKLADVSRQVTRTGRGKP